MYSVSIKGIFRDPSGKLVLLMNERDEWELPGGRIEMGETPQQCLEREVKEELDLTVSAEELIDSYLFEVVPSKHVFIVTYGCSLKGQFTPSISHEHTSVGLFELDALPSNLPMAYRSSIRTWQERQAPPMRRVD